MTKEPKPLVFGDDSAQKAKQAAERNAIEEIKRQHDAATFAAKQSSTPKPLDFGNAPPIQTKRTPNPRALFADTTRPNSIVEEAVKYARANFPNLGTSLDSVERQIKQLIPLNITTIVGWGEPGVSQETDLITKAAGILKMFSEMRGNEICENALKSVSQVNTGGFFQKFTNSRSSVLAYKPNLQVLKTEILSLLPQVDEYVDSIQKAHTRVSINVAALSSVCDAVGTIDDSSLSIAVDNRRRILTQCVMQCDLTVQQLKQAKTLMVQQLSQASQMLDVTIPAFETANATK
jgi:hypothetical protein